MEEGNIEGYLQFCVQTLFEAMEIIIFTQKPYKSVNFYKYF